MNQIQQVASISDTIWDCWCKNILFKARCWLRTVQFHFHVYLKLAVLHNLPLVCKLFHHNYYKRSVWIFPNWRCHAARDVSDNTWPFVQVVPFRWPSLRRRWVMLVFMSPSWERKPAEKRDEGEAQAGVESLFPWTPHDQMKESYLFWHHNRRGRAAPEWAVGVNGIEKECRWGGL